MAGGSGDDDDDDIDAAAAAARVPTGVATPSTSVDRSRVMFFFEKSAGVQFFAARVRDDERFVSTAATTQQMDGEGGVVSDMRDDEWLVRNENVYQNEPLRQVRSSASSLDNHGVRDEPSDRSTHSAERGGAYMMKLNFILSSCPHSRLSIFHPCLVVVNFQYGHCTPFGVWFWSLKLVWSSYWPPPSYVFLAFSSDVVSHAM